MKIKTVFALFCAAFLFLLVQAQAQSLRHPVTTLLAPSEYGLVYLWMPDTSHSGRSHWRWVLQKSGYPPYPPHGSGRLPHTEVEVKSLDDPLLTSYIRRIPAGKSIDMAYPFRQSELAHQAGLTSLQQLCTSRKIGLRFLSISSYAEPAYVSIGGLRKRTEAGPTVTGVRAHSGTTR